MTFSSAFGPDDHPKTARLVISVRLSLTMTAGLPRRATSASSSGASRPPE
jgi:hypothetical protein